MTCNTQNTNQRVTASSSEHHAQSCLSISHVASYRQKLASMDNSVPYHSLCMCLPLFLVQSPFILCASPQLFDPSNINLNAILEMPSLTTQLESCITLYLSPHLLFIPLVTFWKFCYHFTFFPSHSVICSRKTGTHFVDSCISRAYFRPWFKVIACML